MANIFEDKNVRVGSIIGTVLGAVEPWATLGDKVTVVDVLVGAAVLGAIGLGIGYLVTVVKRPRLRMNDSSSGGEIPAKVENSNVRRNILSALIAAIAVVLMGYLLTPRDGLDGRTILASLLTPSQGPVVGEYNDASCIFVGAKLTDPMANLMRSIGSKDKQGCRDEGGKWVLFGDPSYTRTGMSRSDVQEFIADDVARFSPILLLVGGSLGVGALVFAVSRKRL